jgi:hypothetical protein
MGRLHKAMGWETRGGKRYYYRARKVKGRVVKEYVGTGLIGEVAGAVDGACRAERAAVRERRRAERSTLHGLDGAGDRFDRAVEALAWASLVAGGYHRHHRGEWRRRRDD